VKGVYPGLIFKVQTGSMRTVPALPRDTQAHLDIVAEALIAIKERAKTVKGYRICWEPPILRHFQASLAPIE